jgi:hypothetical protein
MSIARIAVAVIASSVAGSSAWAAIPVQWSQGFETNTTGWTSGVSGTSNYGTITRVNTPLTPFAGTHYATITQATTGTFRYSPFTNWGGFASTFPTSTGFATHLAIYLSPSTWTLGSGFDFTSSINTNTGSLLRDYYFHVAVQNNGELLVGADNSTTFAPRLDLASGPNYKVTSNGWYIFQHVFSDKGDGILNAEMRLLDANYNQLFSRTLINPADAIAGVGGNRYGWFSFTRQTTSIDGALLTLPAPGTLALLGLGGLAAARRRRS